MLQALATLFFAAVTLLGLGLIASLLRNDWDAMLIALGFGTKVAAPAPLPPRYRVRTVRRSTVIKVEFANSQRRAAA